MPLHDDRDNYSFFKEMHFASIRKFNERIVAIKRLTAAIQQMVEKNNKNLGDQKDGQDKAKIRKI
jgi:hypothetical protein